MPSMRLSPLDASVVLADPKRATLFTFLSALSDLSYPKTALRILDDAKRISTYKDAIDKALNSMVNPHVLVLGSGGGVLSLLTAKAGAGQVTAIERSRMLYRMAKQILSSNENVPGAENINLMACNIFSVRVAEEEEDEKRTVQEECMGINGQEGTSESAATTATNRAVPSQEQEASETLSSRADVLVTDLFDHSVLGMGLLPAVDYAARFLLAPGAVVLPGRVRVRAVLLELTLPPVNGFDLSPLDTYRWYPGDERVNLAVLPHKALSEPFTVQIIDLQARVAAVQEKCAQERLKTASKGDTSAEEKGEGEESEKNEEEKQSEAPKTTKPAVSGALPKESKAAWEADFQIEVEATSSGKWNAIAVWFELEFQPSTREVSPLEENREVFITNLASGVWPPNSSQPNTPSSPSDPLSTSNSTPAPPLGRSWGQAVQYMDMRALEKGATVQIQVLQDAGQIVFLPTPPPARMRHALAARWHYDMVQDQLRNDAYEAAVRAAVARKRDAGCRQLSVLDIGAGTGLLSMFAVRAGADEAYAVEQSAHMCDVAEETTIMNGFLGKILVLDRDVRRMDTVHKPDGTAPDMPDRADLAVFEIFDSGLIGEGVLHCLTAARAKLLAREASLVPAWATVYAQPLEMRLENCAGLDITQANRWRWRPDYEGLELARCREEWRPLSDPVEVFTFDFYEVESFMRPEEMVLDFKITSDGVVNAVAMWFDLHLDEEITLSTCPYAEKGPTWQQAVQWMPEMKVRQGEQVVVHAKHDTFSISFEIPIQEIEKKGRSTGVPLVDPLWKAAYDAMQGVNSQLVKACVQNPLEYRDVAQAAVQFASRPHDFGLDAGQAAEFCMKMMG